MRIAFRTNFNLRTWPFFYLGYNMQAPLQLEYYLREEDRWCPMELVDTVCGSIENTIKITNVEQLGEELSIRYQYSADTNMWLYVTAQRTDIRVKR